MDDKEKIVRVNFDVPKWWRTKLKLFCINEDVRMTEFIKMAVESAMEEMEGSK